MSYDIKLQNDGEPVCVPLHREGGTYAVSGTEEATLSITYNYSPHYYEHVDEKKGIRWLYGKTGARTELRLRAAVARLGTERDSDYWAPTPGNAGYALSILLSWAKLHPGAVWTGD